MLWLISVLLGLFVFFRLCLRAPFLTRAGLDIIFMVPVMGVCEIVLFAVISTTALGPDSWRHWFVAAVLLCAAGYAASWLNLRALRPEDYDDQLGAVAPVIRTILRRTLTEMAGAAVFTIAAALVLFAMGDDWPYAIALVSLQCVFTLIVGPLTVLREARATEALRRTLAM